MNEFEISRLDAEKALKRNGADFKKAFKSLLTFPAIP